MNCTSLSGIQISAISAAVPETFLLVSESGREKWGSSASEITKAIGVERVHRFTTEVRGSSLSLCTAAAEDLLQKCGDELRSQLGAIVAVTFTPALLLPGNAILAQEALGLSKQTACFDVNLACSGYPYGLYVAGLLARNMQKPVLLLDGDRQSHITSPEDKGTALLFSDAGSATLIEPCADSPDSTFHFSFQTDGSGAKFLHILEGGSLNPFHKASHEFRKFNEEYEGLVRGSDIVMDGMEVFKFVVKEVSNATEHFLMELGISSTQIDLAIFHQANLYLLQLLAKRLKIPTERVPTSINLYGNPSSASIPLTMAAVAKNTLLSRQNRILLCGFGAGLSIGMAFGKVNPLRSLSVVSI